MLRRTKEQDARQEQPRQETSRASGPAGKKRKPRGPLFHSGDPTLAKRLEEKVYRSER